MPFPFGEVREQSVEARDVEPGGSINQALDALKYCLDRGLYLELLNNPLSIISISASSCRNVTQQCYSLWK